MALQAHLHSSLFDQSVPVSSSDLSVGGMFVANDLLLQAGERVTVSFAVPGTSHVIIADARVARVSLDPREPGMGLEFRRLRSIDSTILRRALDRRRQRCAPRSDSDGAFRC